MNPVSNKPISLTEHAVEQMRLRGASEDEVRTAVQVGQWKPAKRGRVSAAKSFAFGGASPMNGKTYTHKTVMPVFANEPHQIMVVTVLVYYHDEK